MHIGLQLIKEAYNILLLMGFYLIMKVQEEVRLLLRKNFQAMCVKKKQNFIFGNLYSKRDWGMQEILFMLCGYLQQKNLWFVISTGKQILLKILSTVSKNLKIKINGKDGINEKAVDEKGNVLLR